MGPGGVRSLGLAEMGERGFQVGGIQVGISSGKSAGKKGELAGAAQGSWGSIIYFEKYEIKSHLFLSFHNFLGYYSLFIFLVEF